MPRFPDDIYTEPSDLDGKTLANLGPLRLGLDVHAFLAAPQARHAAQGPKTQVYVEHYELQPIDPQTNGPQLLYGLRYHTHVTKPDQIKTYHDQVGYWLWEPAAGKIVHTLTIPRGQTAMAVGYAPADARSFELVATRGLETYGICSDEFLELAFKTVEFRIKVTINDDGTWGYDEDTVLMIKGQAEPFHHTDRNRLSKIGEPTPNPLARK